MTPELARSYFTGADGRYHFARWAGPVRAVVFGERPGDGAALEAALGRVSDLTGHPAGVAGSVTEMTYGLVFTGEWRGLCDLPGLGRLLPDVAGLAARLEAEGANQYRVYGFDAGGAIERCFALIRLAGRLGALEPSDLLFRQAVLAHLTWSVPKLTEAGPVGPGPGTGPGGGLRDEVAGVLRAAYDPQLPAASRDPAHAMDLAARVRC